MNLVVSSGTLVINPKLFTYVSKFILPLDVAVTGFTNAFYFKSNCAFTPANKFATHVASVSSMVKCLVVFVKYKLADYNIPVYVLKLVKSSAC